MIRLVGRYLTTLMAIVLIFISIPIEAIASLEVTPEVISSSISEKTITYKGTVNPTFTTIKFKTDRPVVATLIVSGNKAVTELKLSDWLNKKSDYEVSFVPMDYKKASYDKFEPLPPGRYDIKVEIVDEKYYTSTKGIGTIHIVKEEDNKPLVELLDVKITNEVKSLNIEPKIKLKYKVNRPAYIRSPIFRDYLNEYVNGESTQIDTLSDEDNVISPGVFEVEWDLKPARRIFKNDRLKTTLQPNDKEIVLPGEYKIFIRSLDESIYKYGTQVEELAVFNNDVELDILVTLNNGNTEITVLDGGNSQYEKETTFTAESYDIVHYVRAGETLWKISQRYDVSIEDIVKKNNLDVNNSLTIGTKIIVPSRMITFEDISDHWGKDNIIYLSSRKVVAGTGNNRFDPNKNITRAEYITMILKVLNENIIDKRNSRFLDIQLNDWYHDNIETALELGLISGYEDNTFRPNKSITRQEMTAIAVKALYYKTKQQPNMDENLQDTLRFYGDSNDISQWARTSVAIATNYGLVKGKANRIFDPNGISTRAEGATIIKHLFDLIYMKAN